MNNNYYKINGQTQDQEMEMRNLLDSQEGVSYQQFNTSQDLYVADTINSIRPMYEMEDPSYGNFPIGAITDEAIDEFGVLNDAFTASVGGMFEGAGGRLIQR